MHQQTCFKIQSLEQTITTKEGGRTSCVLETTHKGYPWPPRQGATVIFKVPI